MASLLTRVALFILALPLGRNIRQFDNVDEPDGREQHLECCNLRQPNNVAGSDVLVERLGLGTAQLKGRVARYVAMWAIE